MSRTETSDDDSRRVWPDTVVGMSGALLLNHFAAFEHEVGSNVYRTGIESLPAETQAELDALVPSAWLSVSTADQVYAAIANSAGCDLGDLFPTVIERGLEATYTTFWRALLRMATTRMLLRRASTLFAKTYTHGVLNAEALERGYRLRLTQWPGVSRNRLLGTATGVGAVLRLTGHQDVHVTYEPNDDGATFLARWSSRSFAPVRPNPAGGRSPR